MQTRILIPIVVAILLAAIVVARPIQTPKVEGTWYGTLTAPDGTPLQTVLTVGKQSAAWNATFVINGGTALPVRDVNVTGDTLSFMLRSTQAAPPANAILKAKLTNGDESLEGEATLG